MHIGLDIDETLVLHKNRDIKYALEFAKAFNVEYIFVNGKDIKDGIEIDWTEDNLNKFWQSSFGKNFYKYAILTNPNRCVIETLQKRGHKIYLITSRNPNFFQTTQNWIAKKGLQNIELIFTKNKPAECVKNNIEIFVDNDKKTCEEVAKLGIKVYLFSEENSSLQNSNTKNQNNKIKKINSLNCLLKIAKKEIENEK